MNLAKPVLLRDSGNGGKPQAKLQRHPAILGPTGNRRETGQRQCQQQDVEEAVFQTAMNRFHLG